MAIQIYQRPDLLGQSFSKALDSLADAQLTKLNRQYQEGMREKQLEQRSQGLRSLFPQASPEELRGLAALEGRELAGVAQAQAQQQQAMQDALAQQMIDAQLSGEQLGGLQILGAQEEQVQKTPQGVIAQEEAVVDQERVQPKPQKQKLLPEGRMQQRLTRYEEIATNPNTPLSVRKKAEEKRKELAKELREIKKENNKETKEFYRETRKLSKSAKDNNMRLERMENLIQTGQLDDPIFASLLKTLGKIKIDLTSLLSPESQEFQKLSTDFIKDVKNVFGGRITDNEVKLFLQTIPNLSQSNKGKARVIRNLKLINNANMQKSKIMDAVIKNNGGIRPSDLEERVEESMDPILDKLAEEFKSSEGIAEVPSDYNLLKENVILPVARPIARGLGRVAGKIERARQAIPPLVGYEPGAKASLSDLLSF